MSGIDPREPAILVDGLVVRAAARTLLSVPRLQVQAGERVALVGHNGAGKSTLLRALAGFVTPSEGMLAVLGRHLPAAGEPPLPRAALRALRAEVGPVMQGLHLVPRLTARENVLIGALARVPGWRSWARLYPPDLIAEADAALAALGMAARTSVRADRLSGGERQKVAIARLQLQRPRLILADEPTAALDPSAAEEACRALRHAAEGATLVSVVHQPALLPLLADRVVGLHQGRVLWDLPIDAVDDAALSRVYGPRLPETSTSTPAAHTTPNTANGRPAVATR